MTNVITYKFLLTKIYFFSLRIFQCGTIAKPLMEKMYLNFDSINKNIIGSNNLVKVK